MQEDITKITEGKALAAFPGFVKTFNWLVDFCTNLRGESQTEDGVDDEFDGSKLIVDKTNPDFPVIRGGGGGNPGTPTTARWLSGTDSNVKFTVETETKEDGSVNNVIYVDVYYV